MTRDPIQRLLDEHASLQAKLAPFRRALEGLSMGGSDPAGSALADLREGARVMTTDLIAHARREDETLFPAVEEVMGGASGPTSVMRMEHASIHAGADRFKATLHELHDVQHPAIVDGSARFRDLVAGEADAGTLHELGTRLLSLIDDHFEKEEQILFPMSRNMLDAERLRAVASRMDGLDAE